MLSQKPAPTLPIYIHTSSNAFILDIEEQLEMAENRCNTLKDQLDCMKQIYGVNKNALKTRKISNISSFKKSSDEKLSGSSFTDEANEKESKSSYPKRQSSSAIGTDNTGAAVRTINNIINGITDSVNRLSELHVQISETPREIEKARSNTDQVDTQKNFTDESGVLQDNILGSSTGICHKSKNIRRKVKEGKLLNKKPVASLQSIRRGTKFEKRIKSNSTKTSVLDKSVSPMMKRRFLHSLKPNAQSSYPEPVHPGKSFVTEIPPLNISEKPEPVLQMRDHEQIIISPVPHQIVEVDNFEPPQAPRTEITTYSKNYELPTIASRMKQVAKSYLNSFSFKAIPFCAAISTSPSHNIGINIQQVMNILKTRQPINGISPTLAHNIGLAADRLNSRPLSALVSTINSRTG
ncbi:hypothetical protein NQ314_015515 [Rhamnusium bicolor]|uniref:Uncharacterized protein n=1 Tax=Rhamnusium bicolor TaxID=1586634 RepID=A0AAV8WXX1_9CUCU|nr:hypothetical protein NQ314_015515 [Rhamnusium bicolor]